MLRYDSQILPPSLRIGTTVVKHRSSGTTPWVTIVVNSNDWCTKSSQGVLMKNSVDNKYNNKFEM
jgi:hypothetical protein